MIWLAVLLCGLLSFTFSGIEAGILSVNRVRLRHRMKLGDRDALRLNRLLARPERLLVTVLLVTNFMNICAIVLTTHELVHLLGPAAYGVSFAVCLPFYLLVLELLPKALFRRFPYRALAAVSELLRLTDLVLSPLLAVMALVAHLVYRRRAPDQRKLFAGREDFKYLTIESERVGTLSKVERQMIHQIVDFRSVNARDVMTPLAQTPTIGANATLEELAARTRDAALDWLPVVCEEGKVIGLVSVLESLLDRTAHSNVSLHMRRILTVAPDEPAYTVLRKLRAARIRLAAVADAAGQPLGVVNADELMRRLVSAAVA